MTGGLPVVRFIHRHQLGGFQRVLRGQVMVTKIVRHCLVIDMARVHVEPVREVRITNERFAPTQTCQRFDERHRRVR